MEHDGQLFRRLDYLASLIVNLLPLRESKGHQKLLSYSLTNCRYHLRRKANPVGDLIATVPIRATVGDRPQELIEEKSVSTMNLNTRSANFLRHERASDIALFDGRKLTC